MPVTDALRDWRSSKRAEIESALIGKGKRLHLRARLETPPKTPQSILPAFRRRDALQRVMPIPARPASSWEPDYFASVTLSSFTTWSFPTTEAAFEPISAFSSSDRTTPFNVTVPLAVTIFTLCPYVERFLSAITLLRMRRVTSISVVLFGCLSAV